jgi:hypothetical protein
MYYFVIRHPARERGRGGPCRVRHKQGRAERQLVLQVLGRCAASPSSRSLRSPSDPASCCCSCCSCCCCSCSSPWLPVGSGLGWASAAGCCSGCRCCPGSLLVLLRLGCCLRAPGAVVAAISALYSVDLAPGVGQGVVVSGWVVLGGGHDGRPAAGPRGNQSIHTRTTPGPAAPAHSSGGCSPQAQVQPGRSLAAASSPGLPGQRLHDLLLQGEEVPLQLARQPRLALHKALDELGEVEGREAQAVQHSGELRGGGGRGVVCVSGWQAGRRRRLLAGNARREPSSSCRRGSQPGGPALQGGGAPAAWPCGTPPPPSQRQPPAGRCGRWRWRAAAQSAQCRSGWPRRAAWPPAPGSRA